MALPTVAGVARITLGWKVGADLAAQNVLHYKYGGGSPSGATLSTAAGQIADAIAADAGVLGACGTHISFESVTITDLSTMAEPHGSATHVAVGTRAGGPLASGSAALINLIIARRYKGGKPRSYMPFGTTTDLDTSNHFTSGAVADFLTGYTSIDSDIRSAGAMSFTSQINLGYFSGYTLGPAQPGGFRKKVPTPLATPHQDVITAYAPSPRVGSQRRRNRA